MATNETEGAAFPSPGVVLGHAGMRQQGAYDGMTLRQYAAIKLRVPNSGTDWLDEMIRASLRDQFAAHAMQGVIGMERAEEFVNDDGGPMGDEAGDWGTLFICTDFLPEEAYLIADNMMKARDK